MEYVINLLQRDKYLLEKCLNEWECSEYPTAKKEREDKLIEINKAIKILTKWLPN
jgi:flagellin-specific chaperone FliS